MLGEWAVQTPECGSTQYGRRIRFISESKQSFAQSANITERRPVIRDTEEWSVWQVGWLGVCNQFRSKL